MAIACAGFKHYLNKEAEIKRVWVEPEYCGRHIAQSLIKQIEDKAPEIGYKRNSLNKRSVLVPKRCKETMQNTRLYN